MTIEVKVDDTSLIDFTNDEEKMWFENEILVGDGTLILHSNALGNEVGIVKKVSNVQYITT